MKVFLTGATGFLGGELLVEFSKLSFVEKIFCLVRADSQLSAQCRLKKVFAFHDDFYDERKILAIPGDLTDVALSERLKKNSELASINIIVQSGANTSFLPQKKNVVEATNVNGAIQVATWASGLKDLKTFTYVGTAMIAGAGSSMVGRHIFEDESPNPNAEHIVEYTRFKMIGEMNVRRIIPKDKLLVVRPSAILGDSRLWKPRSFDIAWVFTALNVLRLCPFDITCRVDLISVDYASRAIIDLIFSDRNFNCYHLSAGRSATAMWDILQVYRNNDNGRIDYHFADPGLYKEMVSFSKKRLEQCEILNRDYKDYLHYWQGIFHSKGELRILLFGLEKYLRFINLDQTFDNTRLLSEGIKAPEVTSSYVGRTIAFIKDIDIIESSQKNA